MLLGGAFIHLMLGCTFLWGNLAPYVISYFYHFGGKDGTGQKELKMSDSVSVFPINIAMYTFTQPMGAYLLKRLSPKTMLVTSTAVGIACCLISSVVSTFEGFRLLYPTLLGLAGGFGYLPPLYCGW